MSSSRDDFPSKMKTHLNGALRWGLGLLIGYVVCQQALESLNKKDMTEIKSYGRPPALVEKVMEAVMILRGNEPTWAEAKRQLGD